MKTFRFDLVPADYKPLKTGRKFWLALLLFALASLVLNGSFYFYYRSQYTTLAVDIETEEQTALKNQLALGQYKIPAGETLELEEKFQRIVALVNTDNVSWYEIFDGIEQAVQKHIYLKNFKLNGRVLDLRCFALSMEDATTFYKNILKSPNFFNVSYGDIISGTLYSNEGINFSLKFEVRVAEI